MTALREVAMQEPETPWMFDDYRYILENADHLQKVGEVPLTFAQPACVREERQEEDLNARRPRPCDARSHPPGAASASFSMPVLLARSF